MAPKPAAKMNTPTKKAADGSVSQRKSADKGKPTEASIRSQKKSTTPRKTPTARAGNSPSKGAKLTKRSDTTKAGNVKTSEEDSSLVPVAEVAQSPSSKPQPSNVDIMPAAKPDDGNAPRAQPPASTSSGLQAKVAPTAALKITTEGAEALEATRGLVQTLARAEGADFNVTKTNANVVTKVTTLKQKAANPKPNTVQNQALQTEVVKGARLLSVEEEVASAKLQAIHRGKQGRRRASHVAKEAWEEKITEVDGSVCHPQSNRHR